MNLLVEITREDYSDFNKFHYFKNNFKKHLLFYLVCLAIVLLFFNRNGFDLFATIISTILYFLLFYISIFMRFRSFKKIPLENGSFLDKTEYQFLDDNVLYKSEKSEGSYQWSLIKNFEEGTKAYYLYIDRIAAIVIPKRVFKNEEEINAFKKLVEQKIPKIK